MSEDKKEFKKKKVDFALAENIDNSAPFKTIVASIEAKKGKERALQQFVSCTVRRRANPNSLFALNDFIYPSTPRNTFSEEWDGGLPSGFLQSTAIKSLMPWMITSRINDEKPDPVTEMLRQKYEWKTKSDTLRAAYHRGKRTYRKWFGDDILYCPKYYVQIARHLETNPDPYLSSSNNWYYAGRGNMHILQLDGCDYIIHSSFNCLYLTPFYRDNLGLDNANTLKFECPQEMNIMETIQSLNFIALRTKCKIFILKLITTEELRLEKLKEMDSDLPFTSIKFDEFHKNILYVTTLDYKLTIVNMDRMTGRNKKLRGKFPTLTDNWSMVTSGERGNYAHVAKKAITLYDKRTNEPFQRWKKFKFISDIQSCTKLCAVKYCHEKPLMYVAADHHLFLMDMRCSTTKDNNMKPVQRWSHGMISQPTYIDITYDNDSNKELVCLSSQWLEDMCVVSNYSDRLTRHGEIPGLTLPYRPPSILQTLHETHKKNVCYDLYKRIHQRFCTSITGMAMLDRGECQSILLQNSIGDISCHNLYPEALHAFIDDDGFDKLHKWCTNYTKEVEFTVSHVINIRPFLKALKRVPNHYILGHNRAIKPVFKFNENEIYKTFEKQQLDPEFLELWKEQDAEITLDEISASQFFV